MPLAQLVRLSNEFFCLNSNAVAGGAVVGTLTTHTLAPAPALKASFVAAEEMEPFKVCEPPHS